MAQSVGTRRGARRLRWTLAAGGSVLAAALLVGWRWVAGREGSWEDVRATIDARRWDEAEWRLRRWLGGHPHDDQAWLMLGGVLSLRGRDDDALAAFGRVEQPGAAVAKARLLAAEIHLKRRRAAVAEQALRSAVAADPTAIGPKLRLIYLLTIEQRLDEARAILWDAHRLTGEVRHLVTLVGLAATDATERDPSPDLAAFLAETPADPWLRRAQGLALFRQGLAAAALPHLQAAASAFAADPTGRAALAECLLALDRPAEVAEGLGPRPDRPADAAHWWDLKGRAEEALGRAEEARACWQSALIDDPDSRPAHLHLGQSLARAGREADGKPHLDRAEALRIRDVQMITNLDRILRGARDAETCEQLGALCLDAGLRAEARAWYMQAIRAEPIRTSAQLALARLGDDPPPPPSPPVLKPSTAGPEALAKVAEPRVPSAPSSDTIRFRDIAESAGLAFRYQAHPRGDLFIGDTMGGGVGLIDYDGDGRIDVYFVDGCPLPYEPTHPPAPNKLFRNRGDGAFEDVTERAGVGGRGYGMGCAVADYDEDGDDDLFVTGLDATVLYRNNGDGTFVDVTESAGVASDRWTTAAGFGDLDGDGDLDLVVVTYVTADPRHVSDCRDPLGKPMHCPPGRFPPQPDHLFRNDGDGTFTDVGPEAGFDVPAGLGLGLAMVDYDEDGRLDLFVANDATPNFLFHNLGGLRFEEVAVTAGVAYDGAGRATASMGVVADDLDGDGRIDIFHTNFLNEPNTLHRNLGDGVFADETLAVGLDAPSRPVTGFGAAALDADNDGRLDLFVANGHVDDRPWVGHPMEQIPHFYRSDAPGHFELAPTSIGLYFARPLVGRGAAAGDLDDDGRVDLVVIHRDAPAAVLRNESASGHWLGLRLRGRAPKTPIGARATVTVGDRTITRWLTSGTSYLSQHDPRLFFGLGDARTVDHLEVRWPSGAVQSWDDLPADRNLDLTEDSDPVPVEPAERPVR